MCTATTSPRPMPESASQLATACARAPSSVKVSGTSWSTNAVRSPQRRTAARRIEPTGTAGWSRDRGRPGGQLCAAGVGASCVAVMRVLPSPEAHSVAHVTTRVEVGPWVRMAGMSDQRRALVLGGGGITGIAWEIGVLAGLAEAGVDLTGADLVVGTSAGSVVGAQLTSGADVETLFARQLEPPTGEKVARMTRAGLARYGWAVLRSRGDDVAFRRRVGALALAAEQAGLTPTEQERLDVIGSRLVSREWPDRDLRITAVDAESGEFRVLDRTSGVPLLQAGAAHWPV